jgi:peptide/nickel transport system substrate-binding protein
VPILGLDALGSASYGPEAALVILAPFGLAGVQQLPLLTAAIIVLLALLFFSYWQTVGAYPSGGGSFTVASKNLGPRAGLLAAACGGGSGGGSQGGTSTGPKHGDKLTVAFNIEPDTFDPQAQTTTAVQALVNMVVDRLVTYDKNGRLTGQLAKSWQVGGGGLSYTFTLRSGIKFSDGEPFNAQAVKFSLDRLSSPVTFKAQPGVLTVIKDVQVVNDLQVKVDLKNPFAPFVDALTQAAAGITAPGAINQFGNTPATIVHPIGTGPYTLTEFVKGDHVTLTENQSYWGTRPGYTTQVYKIDPDAATRESLVKAGQADVAFNPPPQDLQALANDGDLRVLKLPSDRTVFVAIDTTDPRVPLLQNREVRQALNYAVDKQSIIKNLAYGATVEDDAPVAPGIFGYCKVGTYAYDPAKARQMLKQAGAENLSVTFRSPQGRYIADYDAAQAIAGNLRAVGIKVDFPNPPDWSTYLGEVNVGPAQNTTDIHILGWAPAFLDAAQQMQEFQKAFIPPAGSNTAYYSNPEVESLIAQANSSTDQNQRQTDYCRAEKLIWNDAPWIFLWHQTNPTVTTGKVTGVYGLPNEQIVTTWASPA